jgi:glycyl-tRNA synthetase beta chain
MPDLLFEAGMEEIPARMIAAAEKELTDRVRALLGRERLLSEAHEVHSYSTPRRLAVQVSGVLARQPDATERMTGPAWGVAFKDGQPTAAGQAFAKKAGVAVEALEKTATPKGDYVSATVTHGGRRAVEVLGERLAGELAALYWAKNMYWRAQKPERFVRPVRWIVALLDHEIIPLEFAGVRAGKQTFGHRILRGSEPVVIDHPDDYVGALEAAKVTADVALRRHRIRKALDQETRDIPGARWREDAALVETVTHLTEWPSVVMGSFDREYLALPEEVLVTVMRDHQKYFAVENAQHKLEPYFLAVLNTHPEETGVETIRHGNERVLRARFNDARFFWDVDQKTSLEDRVEMLKSVTFHKELGSYWEKMRANLRIAESLAAILAERGICLDAKALNQAVCLAKADLTTELVKEFTELQGIIGGLYARAQGLGEAVVQAIYWQYSPAAVEDPIPPTVEGQVLGLADRIQTMVAMFGIGLEPTGSKDPFALRRAANAIVKILAESGLPLKISDLLALTDEGILEILADARSETGEKIREFFRERVEFWMRDVRGFSYDITNAIMAVGGWGDIPDAIARAEALTSVRGSDDFRAVCAAFKRTRNIIEQASAKGLWRAGFPYKTVAEDRLRDPAERALFAKTESIAAKIEGLRVEKRYAEALGMIASLRPEVDRFFDTVMVMVDDEILRQNRLALLTRIYFQFSSIAVFSELVSAS